MRAEYLALRGNYSGYVVLEEQHFAGLPWVLDPHGDPYGYGYGVGMGIEIPSPLQPWTLPWVW